MEVPGGGGLERQRPKLGWSATEEEKEEEEEEEGGGGEWEQKWSVLR